MTDERERLREALVTVPRELIEPFVFCDATDKREPCNLPTCRNCTLRAALAHDRPGSVESIEPGNWLRFGPLTTEETEAVVARLDSDYGLADMAGRYAQAWLDVARLLSTLAYNIGRAALSGSSDPEAGGLPTSVDPVVGLKCPMCGGVGRIFDVTAAIEDAQRAGEIRLVEPAARTEAKPETPA